MITAKSLVSTTLPLQYFATYGITIRRSVVSHGHRKGPATLAILYSTDRILCPS